MAPRDLPPDADDGLDERKAVDPPGGRRGVRRDGAARRLADDRAAPRPRRVERDGPQRHDGARARGLHRRSPTRPPAGSRPIAATASSSTTSPSSGDLPVAQRRAVSDFFASAHRALEDLLNETSQLLARVSRHAAVVVGPPGRHGAGAQRAARARSSRGSCSWSACCRTARSRRRCARSTTTSTTPRSRRRRRRRSTGSSAAPRGARSPSPGPTGDPDGRRARAAPHATRSQPTRGRGPRAAVRRRREPARRRAGGVLDHRARRAPARDARAPGRRRVAGPRAPRPRAHGAHRLREQRSTSCATARSCSRPTRSTARPPASSACSARPAWTTATRSPRCRRSRSSSGGTSREPIASDHYEVARASSRNATDDEIKRAFRELARQYHPDANPATRTPRSGSRRSASRTRRCATRSAAAATTSFGGRRARRRRTGGGAATRSASATSSTRSSAATRSGAARPAGPARGPDAEADGRAHARRRRVRHHRTDRRPPPGAVRPLRRLGLRARARTRRAATSAAASGEVRQVRRSILGQIVTASPCAVCDGTGRRILSQCRDCRGDGRVHGATARSRSRCPAGVDDGQRLRLAGRGAAAPRGGQPRRPLRQRPGRGRTPTSSATATTSCTCGTSRSPRPRSVPHSRSRRSRARTSSTVPAGHPAGTGVPGQGRGRARRCAAAGAATSSSGSRSRCPTQLDDEEAELLHRLAELRGEDGRAAREGRASRAAVRVPVDAATARRDAASRASPRGRAVAHVFVDALDDDVVRRRATTATTSQRVRRLRVGEHVTAADGVGAWRPYRVVDAATGALVLDRGRRPARARAVARPRARRRVRAHEGHEARDGRPPAHRARRRRDPARSSRAAVGRAARTTRVGAVGRAARAGWRREAAMQCRTRPAARDRPTGAARRRSSVGPGLVRRRPGRRGSRRARRRPGTGGWTARGRARGRLSTRRGRAARRRRCPRLAVGPHVLRTETAAVAAAAVLTRVAGRRTGSRSARCALSVPRPRRVGNTTA